MIKTPKTANDISLTTIRRWLRWQIWKLIKPKTPRNEQKQDTSVSLMR
jgi:hypothetical protein